MPLDGRIDNNIYVVRSMDMQRLLNTLIGTLLVGPDALMALHETGPRTP